MYLLGIDLNHIEMLPESKHVQGNILEMTETPKHNPNYFFDDYQRKGELYNIPSSKPNLHLRSWEKVNERLKTFGVEVTNFNRNTSLSTSTQSHSAKISVIISNFNGEKYLAEALQSVIDQSYRDFELIVVDDGSTDRSPQIIKEFFNQYPNKVKILLESENQGQGAGFNKGFEVSQGDLITFIDSDDLWMPDKLQKLSQFVDMVGPAALYQHNLNFLRDGNFTSTQYRPLLQSGDVYSETLKIKRLPLFVPTSGLAFPRSVLEKVLPVPVEFRTCADGYLTRTSFCFGVVASCNSSWGYYRAHDNNAVFENSDHNNEIYCNTLLFPALNNFYQSIGSKLRFEPLKNKSNTVEKKTLKTELNKPTKGIFKTSESKHHVTTSIEFSLQKLSPLSYLRDTPFDKSIRELLSYLSFGILPKDRPSKALLTFCDLCRKYSDAGNYSALAQKVFLSEKLYDNDKILGLGLECIIRFNAVDIVAARKILEELKKQVHNSTIIASLQYITDFKIGEKATQAIQAKLLQQDLEKGHINEFICDKSYSFLETNPSLFLHIQSKLLQTLKFDSSYYDTPFWNFESIQVADAFSERVRVDGKKLELEGAKSFTMCEDIRVSIEVQQEIKSRIDEELDRSRILVLPDALVLTGEWLVKTREPFLLMDMYSGTPHHRMSVYGKLGQAGKTADLLLPTSASLSIEAAYLVGGDGNYYHWIIDALPRLLLYKIFDVNNERQLLTGNIAHSFQKEILKVCKIPLERCIQCQYPETVSIKQLYLPLLGPQNRTFQPSYSALYAALHNNFGRSIFRDFKTESWKPGEIGKKIFLIRGSGSHRMVINETEVAQKLYEKGWIIIDCAKLSVSEQVKTFNQSQFIIGSHGAALANISFCRPRSSILEIAFPHWSPPYFQSISKHRDLRYTQMIMRSDIQLTRPDSFSNGYIDDELVEKISVYFQ